jgi:methylenetetrahydrofolate reductase (NADPH)
LVNIMKNEKKFEDQIKDGDFILTAEYLPKAETDGSSLRTVLHALKEVPAAVNVSDNPFSVNISSLAASLLLAQSGIEPIYQVVTRDRNRIAIQSDLLGAASLGIKNMLCLSGFHQALTDNPESANVYDLDSIQLIAMVKNMREKGELLNGAKISGSFPMFTGAAANPFLRPLELNLIRLTQKIESGADFIQTQAVFNVDEFKQWVDAARDAGITEKTAILAGVLPLESAEVAECLSKKYTEFQIPAGVIERLRSAGDKQAQKKEGLAICVEIIQVLKAMQGVRGIHIFSGGNEGCIPEILSASGLSGKR